MTLVEKRLERTIQFLLGEKELDGFWFGEKNPNIRGNFWWRIQLREVFLAWKDLLGDTSEDGILLQLKEARDGLIQAANAGCGCGDECPCAISVTGECCGGCASGIAKSVLNKWKKDK